MVRKWCLMTAVMAAVVAVAGLASARDVLEPIVKKPKLSDVDLAELRSEVAQRAKKLADTGEDAERRKAAVAELIATSKIKNASPAGLDAFALACGDELSSLVTHRQRGVARGAVRVLVVLDRVHTANALARALHSEHPEARFTAARGLHALHRAIAGQPATSRTVLRALGEAGAREKDELVLREIYRAINFCGDVPNMLQADESAKALLKVLTSRVDQLAGGSRDEWKDRLAYKAALDCFAKASPTQQRALLNGMAGFLSGLVDRYGDKGTSKAFLPTLRELVAEAEGALHKMMRAANLNAPADDILSVVKRKPSSKTRKQAKDALAELRKTLGPTP